MGHCVHVYGVLFVGRGLVKGCCVVHSVFLPKTVFSHDPSSGKEKNYKNKIHKKVNILNFLVLIWCRYDGPEGLHLCIIT